MPTIATTPRVGSKTLANPQPTGVGKRGSRGAKPPGRGFGGCPPQIQERGRVARISNPAMSHEWDPEPWRTLSPRGRAKLGGRGGRAPMAGGLGGVSPQNQKRERVAHISNPATSGTKNTSKPSANGGGQRGSRGRNPLAGGLGDVPPRLLLHHYKPITSLSLRALSLFPTFGQSLLVLAIAMVY